jgi:hypothetical protein
VTITLKDVPQPLHQKLKRLAQRNKRSLNQDIIYVLEQNAVAQERRQRILADLVKARAAIKIPEQAKHLDPVAIIRQARDRS